MKHSAIVDNPDTLSHLAALEKDLAILKSSLLKKFTPSGARILKLKGILKGVDITEDDIMAAKKSLYSSIRP